MCTDVIKTREGLEFSCRTCDECISARRFDWVSRAMAERATSKFALSIALTYGDDTQFKRDGAASFRYSDIQKFLKQYRNKALRVHNCEQSLRFLCAGEQGERNGRCHYHIIIFSDIDPTTVGSFSRPSGPVSDRKQMVTKMGQKARRLNWDIWPHGFVTLQEADEGAMHYAISYALKDQFAGDKASGKKRAAKSETFAVGLFRMSKKPPIGWPFIDALLERLKNSGNVLPSPEVRIPDLKGYWYPRGASRKYFLSGLRSVNDFIVEMTGSPAPQWSSLLAYCSKSEKDMEILDGEENFETFEELAAEFKARAAFNESQKQRNQTRRKCGSTSPCSDCLNHYYPATTGSLSHIESIQSLSGDWYFRFKQGDPNGENFTKSQHDGACQGVNPFCLQANTDQVREAFPYSIGFKTRFKKPDQSA